MNDQSQFPQPVTPTPSGDSGHRHSSNSWIVGLVLILAGGLLLLPNLGINFIQIHNWWAFFLLIPGISALANAFQSFRNHGRLNRSGRSSLIGGLVLIFMACIFLFNLGFDNLWPVFMIVGGIAILLNGLGD